ncbi:MarR family transcriptional regulator [uncultured Sphaerochaeta sp.]|uniref:MarR family winged helix-turn-helix transcriptional regulator n=1 Tax=uncultured Sphaerochaeta sp. TaxID=886478 RepID=UPI002A0A9390|nr:MarR family transcriptional regulator [uncultured Sphaerochaeta sp.]
MKEEPRHIGHTIKTLSHLLHRSMTTLLKLEEDSSGSVVQSHLLGYFAHHQKTRILQSDLQQHLGIRRSTMTNILKGMERDGLIVREESEEDKRQKWVVLTDLAEQKCAEHFHLVQEFELAMRQDLNEEQLQQFFTIADTIRRNLETICLQNYENKQ